MYLLSSLAIHTITGKTVSLVSICSVSKLTEILILCENLDTFPSRSFIKILFNVPSIGSPNNSARV